jgi:hypothetical protein
MFCVSRAANAESRPRSARAQREQAHIFAQRALAARPDAFEGESKWLVVESLWSQFTSECQRF